MEYKLKNMSWTEFDERRKTAKTVIIPTGACEVYGPHLPLGSDILTAEKVAELLAARVNGIVSPCCEVGQSKILMDHPGTIAISADTLTRLYREIIENFIHWGFENFFVVNTHAHNTVPFHEMLEDLRQKQKIRYAMIAWWQYIPSLSQDIFVHDAPHGHAGEAGTSVMEYLYPGLVHMERAPHTKKRFTDQWPEITKGIGFLEYTSTGTLGDATLGSPEKGRLVVERALDEMEDCIKNYLEKEDGK